MTRSSPLCPAESFCQGRGAPPTQLRALLPGDHGGGRGAANLLFERFLSDALGAAPDIDNTSACRREAGGAGSSSTFARHADRVPRSRERRHIQRPSPSARSATSRAFDTDRPTGTASLNPGQGEVPPRWGMRGQGAAQCLSRLAGWLAGWGSTCSIYVLTDQPGVTYVCCGRQYMLGRMVSVGQGRGDCA